MLDTDLNIISERVLKSDLHKITLDRWIKDIRGSKLVYENSQIKDSILKMCVQLKSYLINNKYNDIVFVVIHDGAKRLFNEIIKLNFLHDLCISNRISYVIKNIKVSSYTNNKKSSKLTIKSLGESHSVKPHNFKGRYKTAICVVDDILDSGDTIKSLCSNIRKSNFLIKKTLIDRLLNRYDTNQMYFLTLLNKNKVPSTLISGCKVIEGLRCPDHYIFGFGMDYNDIPESRLLDNIYSL